MMCAAEAAKNGHSVTLYERNEKLGKKLFITGKGGLVTGFHRVPVDQVVELADEFRTAAFLLV